MLWFIVGTVPDTLFPRGEGAMRGGRACGSAGVPGVSAGQVTFQLNIPS